MKRKPSPGFFDENVSAKYDESNRRMRPISDNLHYLIRLILSGLPEDARILSIGVGTGAEIISMAEWFPGWRFTGVDPSSPMLDICREKLRGAGVADRCLLVNGYAEDIAGSAEYDAVLCMFVMHFIRDEKERLSTYRTAHTLLKPGGYFISADISYDMASDTFPDMMLRWVSMQADGGTTLTDPEQVTKQFQNDLAVLPQRVVGEYLKESGFPLPVVFFQSLFIHAWYARKS